MTSEITPKKLGLRTHPLALILVYDVGDNARQRIMPVRLLNKFGPVDTVVQEMKMHHGDYLAKVPDIRLEKMLRILQESLKGRSVDEAVQNIGSDFCLDPEQDLNKVSEEELQKKKKVMESSFVKNRLKPGDENYEYDRRVDFESTGTGEKVAAGWDESGDEEDFWN